MPFEVTRDVIEAMLRAAENADPAEACGILLGEGDRITCFAEAGNVHPTPKTQFEIDPQVLIDAHRAARSGGLSVLGYFHSHPKGAHRPSVRDQAEAPGDGRIWAIAAGGEIGFWIDDPAGFRPLSYSTDDS